MVEGDETVNFRNHWASVGVRLQFSALRHAAADDRARGAYVVGRAEIASIGSPENRIISLAANNQRLTLAWKKQPEREIHRKSRPSFARNMSKLTQAKPAIVAQSAP